MARITIDDIQAAGVVGAGGAGFPTHAKLRASVGAVLLNAAECEPLLHKDKEILRTRGPEVIEGLARAAELVGAKRAIIGIKGKYGDVIDALQRMLPRGMSIHPLADAYPAGDEMVLVYDVLGRVPPPGGLPLEVGAVVMNVETALNVAGASERPVTEKFVSVAGAVAEPQTIRAAVGTPLSACVAAAGGATVDEAAYIVGGVMMGALQDDHEAPVDKTTGAVVVLSENHRLVQRRRQDYRQLSRIGRSACDQCSFCTELCPRYLLGHPVEPHRAMRSLGFNLTGEPNVLGTSFCCECNLCSLYSCPEDLDPKNVCAANKRRLAEAKRRWASPPFRPGRAAMLMEGRKAPMGRLIAKLGLGSFDNVGPMNETPPKSPKVGIRLKQHVGAPCEPAVNVGDGVAVGQTVGRVPTGGGQPALGAPVHASVAGRVTAIEDGVVWISQQGNG